MAMPDTQQRESDGRPLGMDSAEADLRREASALRCAIGDAIVALERVSAHLAIAEREAEHASGLEGRRPPSSAAAVAAGGPGAPGRASAPRRRRVRGWLSRTPRACAVCRCEAASRSKRELAHAGWTITGRQAICARCGSTGWRLAEQGGLPFRTRSGGAAPGREADPSSAAHVPSSHSR
jgi:hypothetical protein